MLIRTVIFLIIFGSIFSLAYLFYPLLEAFLKRWQDRRVKTITPRLNEMFLDVSLKRLMFLDIITPVVTASIGYYFTRNLIVTLIAGALGLVIPIIIVRKMELARRQKFAGQIVDGLTILSSSLKAGLSLLQSFETLIEEMPAPISQEFGLAVRQLQMGVSLEDALNSLKKRMRVDDLDMVVTAIMVARETGGNLTEIFSQVASSIQERNKLLGRVNALCVQAKLQGVIMSLLPILFGLFVYKVNPRFFDVFLKDNLGKMLLIYAAISEVLGIIFIRRFSKIDI